MSCHPCTLSKFSQVDFARYNQPLQVHRHLTCWQICRCLQDSTQTHHHSRLCPVMSLHGSILFQNLGQSLLTLKESESTNRLTMRSPVLLNPLREPRFVATGLYSPFGSQSLNVRQTRRLTLQERTPFFSPLPTESPHELPQTKIPPRIHLHCKLQIQSFPSLCSTDVSLTTLSQFCSHWHRSRRSHQYSCQKSVQQCFHFNQRQQSSS